MSCDVSVLIPSIRTHNWRIVLDTLKESCKKYSYEVVFVCPFDPPSDVTMDEIKFIKTYRCPSAAAQIGLKQCKGELTFHAVDDAKFTPDSIDNAVDLYKQVCTHKDVVNMRYTEGENYIGDDLASTYWIAHTWPALRLRGVPSHYKISLHFLINTNYFLQLGGLDCSYEYLNFNLIDLMFRIQHDGGSIYDSSSVVSNCNWYPGESVDHKPIHEAFGSDYNILKNKYDNTLANHSQNEVYINLENWKNCPEVWERRFKQLYKTYQEMIEAR